MTKYESLMLNYEKYINKCKAEPDNLKAQFYKRVADGYKQKADKLALKEAVKC